MHKRRLVTPRVVGMAMLLMGVSAWGILASDGTSSAGDATTPPAASATKPSAKRQRANYRSQATNGSSAETDRANAEGFGGAETASGTTHQARSGHGASGATGQPETGRGHRAAAQPANAAAARSKPPNRTPASLGEVASTSPMIPQSQKKVENAIAPIGGGDPSPISAARTGGEADAETSPLQFHIGTATLTPVGFMDFTSVFRSKTAGGNIGTSFGSIPYATVTSGLTPYQDQSHASFA